MTIVFRDWAGPKIARGPVWPSALGRKWSRAARSSIATAKRVFPIIAAVAFFALALAATIALRLAIWLPLYYGH